MADRDTKKFDYRAIDFVLFAISFKQKISREQLLSEYAPEFEFLNIDEDYLDDLLNKLTEDGYIAMHSNNYLLTILGHNSMGYADKYRNEEKTLKKKEHTDIKFKIFGVIIPIVFGLSTVTLGILNYQNSEKVSDLKKVVARQLITIDSLNKIMKTTQGSVPGSKKEKRP